MTIYGTTAAFKTYQTDRGRTVLASWTDAMIAAALLVASEWLDAAYANLWSGVQTAGYAQDRQWPRTGAVTNTPDAYAFGTTEIPVQVPSATYEAAFRQMTSPGSLSVDFTPSKFLEARVEGAITVKYNNTIISASDVQTQIGVIQSLMYPLIDPAATGSYSPYSGPSALV